MGLSSRVDAVGTCHMQLTPAEVHDTLELYLTTVFKPPSYHEINLFILISKQPIRLVAFKFRYLMFKIWTLNMWLPPKIVNSALLKPSLCKSILILSSQVNDCLGIVRLRMSLRQSKHFLFTPKFRLGLVSTQLRIQSQGVKRSNLKVTIQIHLVPR
jgi:hypothetical protein